MKANKDLNKNVNEKQNMKNGIKDIVGNYVEKTKEAEIEMRENKHIAKAEMQDALLEKGHSFENKMKDQIVENENKMKELKEKIVEKGKLEVKSSIAQLEQKNADLKAKLIELKEAGNEKRESLEKEFKHDMDGLVNALKDIFKKNIE